MADIFCHFRFSTLCFLFRYFYKHLNRVYPMQIRPHLLGYFIRHYTVSSIGALLLILASFAAPFVIKDLPLLAVALFFVGIGILAISVAHTILFRQTTSLTLKEEEICYEEGILSHELITAPVHMVTDSTITRSFFDKIIGAATLGINTSGSPAKEIMAENFNYNDVKKMHDEMYKLINELPNSLREPPAPKGAGVLDAN